MKTSRIGFELCFADNRTDLPTGDLPNDSEIQSSKQSTRGYVE